MVAGVRRKLLRLLLAAGGAVLTCSTAAAQYTPPNFFNSGKSALTPDTEREWRPRDTATAPAGQPKLTILPTSADPVISSASAPAKTPIAQSTGKKPPQFDIRQWTDGEVEESMPLTAAPVTPAVPAQKTTPAVNYTPPINNPPAIITASAIIPAPAQESAAVLIAGPIITTAPEVQDAPGAMIVPGVVPAPVHETTTIPEAACVNQCPDGGLMTRTPRRFEAFPSSLLWEPMLANKADPRISFMQSNLTTPLTRSTSDISIGQALGIARWSPAFAPRLAVQADGFAVVHARFSEFDVLVAEDYRAGVLGTFQLGKIGGKFGYEHLSTHLGDEIMEEQNLRRREFQKDELVGGLDIVLADRLRIYGVAGYAFSQVVPDANASRWRFDVGGEWFRRQATGRRGQPFAAVNVNFDGARMDFSPTVNLQAGWMWRKSESRLGQFRVYGEYFNGRSLYGQLATVREEYVGFGVSLDY